VPAAPTPPDDFEQWETETIRKIVEKFLWTRSVPRSVQFGDLPQEAFIHWSAKRGLYRASAGATRRTYLDRVVQRRLISLQREWNASKRRDGGAPLSLDEPLADDDESPTLGDTLSDQTPNDSDLALDVTNAVARLTTRQQQIVLGLRHDWPVPDIAERTGISKDTLYEELKVIRRVFRDAGLRGNEG